MKQNQLIVAGAPAELSAHSHPLSADAWNKGVKCATLLYHWGMIDGYDGVFRTMDAYQRWVTQACFKHDDSLLPQLQAQLPPITGPRIWACFHVGPYALLARALLQRGHALVILLKDEVFEEQHAQYIQQFKLNFGREPRDTELYFVRSSGARSLIKLRQYLGKGFHVLCYIDGQEGASLEKGWTQVRVHNMLLDVRMGAAVLSQWTNTPICPLLMTVDNGRLRVYARPDIQVTGREDCSHALQYAYQLLETLNLRELIQWEFLHSLFDSIRTELFLERKDLWIPVDVKGELMLFNMGSRQIIAVPPESFSKIADLREHLPR